MNYSAIIKGLSKRGDCVIVEMEVPFAALKNPSLEERADKGQQVEIYNSYVERLHCGPCVIAQQIDSSEAVEEKKDEKK